MLEFVHPVEQMEMKIDKLVLCEPANVVVSLTRGGLGFWSMETGALEYRIADTTGGIVFLLCMRYSRVHKSSDSFFSKILEKPSMVQKKMIPHIKELDFSLR